MIAYRHSLNTSASSGRNLQGWQEVPSSDGVKKKTHEATPIGGNARSTLRIRGHATGSGKRDALGCQRGKALNFHLQRPREKEREMAAHETGL